MVTLKHVHLEKSTEDFIDQLTAKGGPPIYKLTPIEARAVLESMSVHRLQNRRLRLKRRSTLPEQRGSFDPNLPS